MNDEQQEMFEDLICGKIRFLFGNIKKQSITPLTFYNSELPQDFDEKYGFLLGKPAPFNIYSFTQIGLSDPFALETSSGKFKLPTKSKDLVYPISRYGNEYTPKCIYIPTL